MQHPADTFMKMRRTQSGKHAAILTIALALASPLVGGSPPLLRTPQLHPGQKFVYRVRYQTQKVTRSESHIVTPLIPEAQKTDVERWLSVEIKSITGSGADTKTAIHTQVLPSDGSPRQSSDEGIVDFALLPDGQASTIHGLELLPPDEQALWRQWIAQFALSWTFPANGVKPGEKWKNEEPVVGAPLAKLTWEKNLQYVRDEPCPQRGDNGSPAKPLGRCAVVVTTTSLKQRGSHDEATPEDYKVHQLKTSGTVQGKTQLITFISLQTGFVERATEDSAQTMDVLIAKADDSNKAHFNVDATSHTELILMQ